MRRVVGRTACVVAVLTLGGALPPAHAEEDVPTEYAYGTVKELNGSRLVVSEYDYATETTAEIAYTIDPNVKLADVAAVSEIAVGDLVDIDYVVKNDERVAVALAVEKPGAEEPLGPEDDDL